MSVPRWTPPSWITSTLAQRIFWERPSFLSLLPLSSSPPSQESEKAKQNSSAYKTFWILLLTRWRGHGSKWFWCFLYSENFANGRNQNWLTFGPTAFLMAGRTLIVAGLRQRLICTCVWGLQSTHILDQDVRKEDFFSFGCHLVRFIDKFLGICVWLVIKYLLLTSDNNITSYPVVVLHGCSPMTMVHVLWQNSKQ